jgi:hypothetical protein
MAANKTRKTRGSLKRQRAELRGLLLRARAETTKLLKRRQARMRATRGPVRRARVEATLQKLLLSKRAEVADLRKRNQAGTITQVDLNSGLDDLDGGFREVETRIRRMLNHVFLML